MGQALTFSFLGGGGRGIQETLKDGPQPQVMFVEPWEVSIQHQRWGSVSILTGYWCTLAEHQAHVNEGVNESFCL